jgi:hypothetical protein
MGTRVNIHILRKQTGTQYLFYVTIFQHPVALINHLIRKDRLGGTTSCRVRRPRDVLRCHVL